MNIQLKGREEGRREGEEGRKRKTGKRKVFIDHCEAYTGIVLSFKTVSCVRMSPSLCQPHLRLVKKPEGPISITPKEATRHIGPRHSKTRTHHGVWSPASLGLSWLLCGPVAPGFMTLSLCHLQHDPFSLPFQSHS